MKPLYALLTGLVFGVGIAISGMMNPAKVLNFFDLAGSWDPSLAFVMGGALIVAFIGYRLVWKRGTPVFAERFQFPPPPPSTRVWSAARHCSASAGALPASARVPPFPRSAPAVGRSHCSWVR